MIRDFRNIFHIECRLKTNVTLKVSWGYAINPMLKSKQSIMIFVSECFEPTSLRGTGARWGAGGFFRADRPGGCRRTGEVRPGGDLRPPRRKLYGMARSVFRRRRRPAHRLRRQPRSPAGTRPRGTGHGSRIPDG